MLLQNFSYSQEEGTPAYELGDPIKEREKNRRLEELIATQEDIALELNQAKVGSVLKVMVDTKEDGHYIGRTEFDSPDVSVLPYSNNVNFQMLIFVIVTLAEHSHQLLLGDFFAVGGQEEVNEFNFLAGRHLNSLDNDGRIFAIDVFGDLSAERVAHQAGM